MGEPIELQEGEDFVEFLKKNGTGKKVVVVDFFATWCGPCRMIAPKLKEMISADVAVVKVDVDECPEVAKDCDVSAMPTFFIYKAGSYDKPAATVVGANIENLRAAVNGAL